jgi:hypothetical protein
VGFCYPSLRIMLAENEIQNELVAALLKREGEPHNGGTFLSRCSSILFSSAKASSSA